jgi:acyl-CoA thioesterase FadM
MTRVCTRPILIGDVDSAGIAFTGRLIAIALEVLEQGLAAAGLDWSRLLREGRYGAPLVHLDADFKRPLRHGEVIHGAVVCECIGESSYTCRVDLIAAEAQDVAASVRFVAACIDAHSFTAIAVPEAFRPALERLMATDASL